MKLLIRVVLYLSALVSIVGATMLGAGAMVDWTQQLPFPISFIAGTSFLIAFLALLMIFINAWERLEQQRDSRDHSVESGRHESIALQLTRSVSPDRRRRSYPRRPRPRSSASK